MPNKEKTPGIAVSCSHSGVVIQVLQTFGNQTTVISAGRAGYKIVAFLDLSDNSEGKKLGWGYVC